MPRLNLSDTANPPIGHPDDDYGIGKPMVLIHVWLLSRRLREAQVPTLVAAAYRVVADDRRGVGQSPQSWSGYDRDTLATDLNALMTDPALKEAALLGFSMSGREIARYIGNCGSKPVAKAGFATAVPPYLYKGGDNLKDGLDDAAINECKTGITSNRIAFLNAFTSNFVSAKGKRMVSESQRGDARNIAAFASPKGTLDCVHLFSYTDFRVDLPKVIVATRAIHNDADAVVPIEASGRRMHKAMTNRRLPVIEGAPHGCKRSHAVKLNAPPIEFLKS